METEDWSPERLGAATTEWKRRLKADKHDRSMDLGFGYLLIRIAPVGTKVKPEFESLVGAMHTVTRQTLGAILGYIYPSGKASIVIDASNFSLVLHGDTDHLVSRMSSQVTTQYMRRRGDLTQKTPVFEADVHHIGAFDDLVAALRSEQYEGEWASIDALATRHGVVLDRSSFGAARSKLADVGVAWDEQPAAEKRGVLIRPTDAVHPVDGEPQAWRTDALPPVWSRGMGVELLRALVAKAKPEGSC